MRSLRDMAARAEEPGTRKVQLVLASVAAGLVALDVLATLVFPWWRHRMITDFWPVDSSRIGEKIVGTLVQGVIGMIVVAVLWPPLRRRITRLLEASGHRAAAELHRANADLHRRLGEVHGRLDEVMSHHVELHAKLDHIIRHHPDVPEFPRPDSEPPDDRRVADVD